MLHDLASSTAAFCGRDASPAAGELRSARLRLRFSWSLRLRMLHRSEAIKLFSTPAISNSIVPLLKPVPANEARVLELVDGSTRKCTFASVCCSQALYGDEFRKQAGYTKEFPHRGGTWFSGLVFACEGLVRSLCGLRT